MWQFEINGNLSGPEGLKNFDLFQRTILEVYSYYHRYLSLRYPNGALLYIDNATRDSGYTPVTTPIFGKYINIKLAISPTDNSTKIAYQFSHELMHYVFYAKYGINKPKASDSEETICTAASLIYLHDTDLSGFELLNEHTKNLEYDGYRNGAYLAKDIDYNFTKLIDMI